MANTALNPLERIKQASQTSQDVYSPDTVSDPLSKLQNNRQQQEIQLQRQLEAITRAKETGQEGGDTRWGNNELSVEGQQPTQTQGSVLPGGATITQAYGVRNPNIEVFSKDGVNRGVDFGIKEGTPLALPPGNWKVVQAFGGARGRGRIGDNTNSGYGNSVLVMNQDTGEMMRFSHLQKVNLAQGQTYSGGTVLGLSGATGNVTGPHLDLEYKNALGQFMDVMKSPYAQYLFGK